MTNNKKTIGFHDDPNREKVKGGDLQKHGKSQQGWERWANNGGGKIYNNDKQEKNKGKWGLRPQSIFKPIVGLLKKSTSPHNGGRNWSQTRIIVDKPNQLKFII